MQCFIGCTSPLFAAVEHHLSYFNSLISEGSVGMQCDLCRRKQCGMLAGMRRIRATASLMGNVWTEE